MRRSEVRICSLHNGRHAGGCHLVRLNFNDERWPLHLCVEPPLWRDRCLGPHQSPELPFQLSRHQPPHSAGTVRFVLLLVMMIGRHVRARRLLPT